MHLCVSDAVGRRAPFVVEDTLAGVDSRIANYLVGDANGNVFIGNFDADPSGGSGSCALLDVVRCVTFQIQDVTFPGSSPFFCLDSRESFRVCGPDVRPEL